MVVARSLAADVRLDVAAAALDPVVDRPHGEHEAAARVLRSSSSKFVDSAWMSENASKRGSRRESERIARCERHLDEPAQRGAAPVEALVAEDRQRLVQRRGRRSC